MIKLILLLTLLSFVSAVDPQDCMSLDERNYNAEPEGCAIDGLTYDLCCKFGVEGCIDDTCAPTTTTTTAEPTTSPVTTQPTTSPVVTTGTPTTTTNCVCPPALICDPQVTSSKGKAIGCGTGSCDCDGGVIELRFKYRGTPNNVDITINYDADPSKPVCSFQGIKTGQQVICNILKAGANVAYAKFAKETSFTVTDNNGYTCSAQYHTSCSSDIVGVVLDDCPDLVVSGWADGSGGDCDDDVDDSDCNCPGSVPEFTTTTSNPIRVPVVIGDVCYCDVSPTGTATTSTAAPASKSKGSKGSKGRKGKSKGKKGSKKKNKKKGAGLGVGDCDCDGGQTELTLLWSGTETVDMDFYYKDGQTKIGTAIGVEQGKEAVLNILDYKVGGNAVYPKLGTNTFINIKDSSGTDYCELWIHTSCSRDIVGTYGTDGTNTCGTQIIVSGWRDANNQNDGGKCTNGLEECSCDGTVWVQDPMAEPTRPEGTPRSSGSVEVAPNTCFCSTQERVVSSDLAPGVTVKPDKSMSRGYGKCTCDKKTNGGGIKSLRFVYLPVDTAKITDQVTIELAADDGFTEIFCSYDGVTAASELSCAVEDTQTTLNYARFLKETYVRITYEDGTVVTGSWHTSCSADIVGWTAAGAREVIVTGWEDNAGAGECDDGFESCECTNPCQDILVALDCVAQAACTWSEGIGPNDGCQALASSLYHGSDAPKAVTLFWAVAVTAVAAFFRN